ncbi:Adaptor protein complex AP-1, gamma subunit [Cynara cardunculus var. scolymus]|uniref:AP-1 complex subunit gamma n=1 Tax=Cynara cardunculus var. scolymus TaxID=59895 RepID=A0A103XVQ1_CYNCS|nr:Adaptor protein complex AP-1, gamma subunit [Cynara cardunculus var. scolymus]
MNPFSSGTRLRDMIRAIRACKTAAEERAVVRKECASIRAAVSDNDNDYRHRNLAKLMFIHMLGYPTHFGQMECLKLIAAPGFPEKRIGYLGLMLLLDERQEVLMLVTNSLKQDLNHTNQYIVGLALCALGNICSAEMARDLAPEVERLLQFRDPNVRKKGTTRDGNFTVLSVVLRWSLGRMRSSVLEGALGSCTCTYLCSYNVQAALCSIRIVKKVPDLVENFVNPVASLLKEKHHGVLLTAMQLCADLCILSEEALEYFKKRCTEGLVKVLKDAVNSPYAPEYDISGIADPFLQIRLLRLLRILGHGDADASDCMNDVLAQVATKTESNKNAGNAILYECVETILSIEDSGGLRVLAINILGRFLSNRDNNIRYVALNMLMKAISVDGQAVQRHRATILECVKDSDASIRKRALELVYLLVNESNVKPLTKELIDYLEYSNSSPSQMLQFHFHTEDHASACISLWPDPWLSPDKLWYIDQMLKVLCEAGNYVKDEVWHALIVVITNASNLHGYTVRSLYRAIQTSVDQEAVVRVAVWCIGEYGDLLMNNTGMLDLEEPITVSLVLQLAIKRHTSDLTTRAMCLIALLKLSSRFPSSSQRIKDIVTQSKGSLLLELQQRSIEFDSIIEKHQNLRAALVERMPVLDEATYSGRRSGSVPAAVSTSQGNALHLPNGVAKMADAPLLDLLDLSVDEPAAPNSSGGNFLQDLLGADISSSSSQSGKIQAQKSGTDVLLDLLSTGSAPAQNGSSTPDIFSISQDNKTSISALDSLSSPMVPPVQASPITGEDNGPAHPPIVAFESSSLKIIFNFSKEPESPQTTLIEANFTNKSSEVYTDFIFQAAVPKKSIMMRIRISYKLNGKDMLEEGQISNIPRDL